MTQALELAVKWLQEFSEADLDEIAADGGVTVGMVYQQEARTVQVPRLAALQSLRQISQPDSGWRPIETAPKDGRVVQLFARHSQGGYQFVGCWAADCWRDNLAGDKHDAPTHWRPLPPAPLDLAGDDEPRPVEPAGEITNSSILRSELNSAHVQLPPEKLVSLCWKAADFIAASQSPGHTDLMVTPESIDAFMEANPPACGPTRRTDRGGKSLSGNQSARCRYCLGAAKIRCTFEARERRRAHWGRVMIFVAKWFGATYVAIGVALGLALHVIMPAASFLGCAYYAAIWPAFISAGTFHTPSPPIPFWCFTFKDAQP